MFCDSIPVLPSRIKTYKNEATDSQSGANTENSVTGDWPIRDITGVGSIKEQYKTVQSELGEQWEAGGSRTDHH